MDRRRLSVAIVCQDEEDRIRACLESVRFADEIVVVDSGSSDQTVEVVREYTELVHHREWKGWRDQKSWARDQCSSEWVLTLDADEVVTDDLRREIEEVLSREKIDCDGFTIPRLTSYQGRWIRRSGWYPDRKLRLYRKDAARFGGVDPHEVIEVDGKVGELVSDMHHYTYRDLHHQARQLARYATVNAEAKHQAGKRFRLAGLLFAPPYAFIKSYFFQLGLLDGMPGFLIAVMNGYYTFLKYARLWELSREV